MQSVAGALGRWIGNNASPTYLMEAAGGSDVELAGHAEQLASPTPSLYEPRSQAVQVPPSWPVKPALHLLPRV